MIPLDPTLLDPFSPTLALRAPEPLGEFNRAGVLAASDIHVALELGRLAGVDAPETLLAGALAVRAPRLGHVFVDLASVSRTVTVEDASVSDLAALPWPDPPGWISEVGAASSLVALGEEDDEAVRPLRLVGSRLYLDRYWREERQLAAGLARFAGRPLRSIDSTWLADRLVLLFPAPEDELQRVAAACLTLRSLGVVAGGPGTGKTTTVARAAALLIEEALVNGRPAPLIALCAPTGKAAARLQDTVHIEAASLPVDERVRAALLELRASTIHRLLGWRPGSHSRFRHDAANRLPHDGVIVDETSMVSLSLMGRLTEAIRGDARLVLVGDPDQLTAIEAGAVLRDIVGPAGDGLRLSSGMHALLRRVTVSELPAPPALEGSSSFGDGIVALRRGHRFGAAIGNLADAIRRGDADAAAAAARAAPEQITWVELDVGDPELGPDAVESALSPLRQQAVEAGAAIVAAARRGEAQAALVALAEFRLLCAHRRGPYGALTWGGQNERWLADAVEDFAFDGGEYAGRPLLVTENDYELRLYNGDSGVVIRTPSGGLGAAFERDGQVVTFAPSRLASVQTLHAMTIHKSQGSQFQTAAVLLPDPGSRILTRELLYTAVTRARRRLIVVGSEASLRAAVTRPVARSTGLRERLWTNSAEATVRFG